MSANLFIAFWARAQRLRDYNYVIKELSLNKTQTAKLDDATIDSLMVFAGVIAMAVLGITEANPTEDDQKSDAV